MANGHEGSSSTPPSKPPSGDLLPGPVVGIVTVSDRASRGEYEDRGGPEILALLGERLAPCWRPVRRLVPDEGAAIEEALIDLCDRELCSLILTTGGTGPAPRDVTPEVTRSVLERSLPGFGERMRAVAADRVPTSILSRQEAGIRGRSLIVNLPGSPKAIRECLEAILPAIPHCLELIGGDPLRLADGSGRVEHG